MQIITEQQRSVQEQEINKAISLLSIAGVEIRTGTSYEVSQTIDIALEILNKVNDFLKSR
jgi:hypothetical protein